MARSPIELSVVVPLFNEHEIIPELLRRVGRVCDQLRLRSEVVIVNDGSTDQSRRLLEAAALGDERLTVISLSRNYGHQIAITAGLQYARGGIVAVMDGDLQDPPEVLPQLIDKLREGHDVVYAVRTKRKEGLLKRFAYASFYRLHNKLSPLALPLDSGDFCAMSRRVVDAIVSMPESHRFVRGLRSFVGYSQAAVEYEREGRSAGTSKYSVVELIHLALDGLVAFSVSPLRVATVVGLISFAGALVGTAYVTLWRIFTTRPLPGFAALFVVILYFGSVQLLCTGVLGEYIGRIYSEVKRRPLFFVSTVVRDGVVSEQGAPRTADASTRSTEW
jgi:dolichol-phosphate mannosyltransferase